MQNLGSLPLKKSKNHDLASKNNKSEPAWPEKIKNHNMSIKKLKFGGFRLQKIKNLDLIR